MNIERRFNKNISSPIALITIDKNTGRAFVLLGENVEKYIVPYEKHLGYELINADISIDGTVYNTYLCSSENCKKVVKAR